MSYTDAYHQSLALIDYLAPIVPRIAAHDRKLARALRGAATAAPLHVAQEAPERAHLAAGRVHVMLTMAQAWGSRQAIRDRHPAWSEHEVLLEWVAVHYGRELAEKVQRYLKERAP